MLIDITLFGGPGDGEQVTLAPIIGSYVYWSPRGDWAEYKKIEWDGAILPWYVYSGLAGYMKWQQSSV